MIKLERVRTEEAIPESFRGDKRVEQAVSLIDGQIQGEHEFEDSYWKNSKDQLIIESCGKCAYCEAPTATVAHGDVEHYHPKSVYWWLAYCYDNYLYACQICNQSYKGDNFPIHGVMLALDPPFPDPFPDNLSNDELMDIARMFAPDPLNDADGYPMAKFMADVAAAKADLPNPYYVNPEVYFKWVADPTLKEVSVQPRFDHVDCLNAHAAAEEFYGLNREELLRIRWQTYETIEIFKNIFLSGDEETKAYARDGLLSAGNSDAEFAGMARYFIRDEWKLDLF